MANTKWETVIGLEVHVQLKTHSKIFSGSSTTYGAPPNTQACAIDLGFPGVLPVLNKEVVKMAAQFGLATGATVSEESVFARKNYFYPDLPKGYQISQFELPIVIGGHIEIQLDNNKTKIINLTRAHLEEDAGKSLHDDFGGLSGIDLNRASVPLLEIVSEPELHSSKEAVAYLKALHSLVRYLDICNGNMQEGSFRCDANVSIRPKGETKLGTRTETKNINSFRFVEKSIEFEIDRQIKILEKNGKIIQETRLYDSDKNETRPMRTKEEANDYRYFPDPDLLPVILEKNFLDQLKSRLPELPTAKRNRFIGSFGLSQYDANVLTSSKELAHYYEDVLEASNKTDPKLAANWVMGELLGALNKANFDITNSPVPAKQLGLLIQRIKDKTISGKIAKTVFTELFEQYGTVDNIIDKKGLKQVTDNSAIERIVDEILKSNPKQLEDYCSGKNKLFGFFVGQVMKASKGKANPEQVNAILKEKLL